MARGRSERSRPESGSGTAEGGRSGEGAGSAGSTEGAESIGGAGRAGRGESASGAERTGGVGNGESIGGTERTGSTGHADAAGSTATVNRAEVAARLHSAAIHLLRRVRREDPASGLTPARLSALSVLVFGGPRTIGGLAKAEQVRAPTMTRLVGALETDGYIAREPSPDDGRAVIVRATDRAVGALKDARARRLRHVLALLEPLSDEEWRAVRDVVELIERELARPAAHAPE